MILNTKQKLKKHDSQNTIPKTAILVKPDLLVVYQPQNLPGAKPNHFIRTQS